MWGDSGAIIGMKVKEKKFKDIIKKLLTKKSLSEEDKQFLEKENINPDIMPIHERGLEDGE